jgi:hypothetical protein
VVKRWMSDGDNGTVVTVETDLWSSGDGGDSPVVQWRQWSSGDRGKVVTVVKW